MMWRPANFFTLARVALIPPLVGAFYVPGPAGHWIAFGLFAAAALTDFFDGYIARARREVSEFGRVFDPMADKILVAAALLMLVAFDRAPVVAVVLILTRELLMAGLREWLSGRGIALDVSRQAKWKTATQMAAIGLLLVGEAGPAAIPISVLGEACLWLAALLTWSSALAYLRIAWKELLASTRREELKRERPPGTRQAG